MLCTPAYSAGDMGKPRFSKQDHARVRGIMRINTLMKCDCEMSLDKCLVKTRMKLEGADPGCICTNVTIMIILAD